MTTKRKSGETHLMETDSLSIWNAGPLPPSWTAETLLEKHTSQPYNPDIANTFFRTGLIEAWGRGYERIAEACREQGTPEPTVESDGNGVWVKWAWANPASDADRIRSPAEVPGVQVGVQVGDHVGVQVGDHVGRVLEVLVGVMTRDELLAALGLEGRRSFSERYLRPAVAAGLVEMTLPEKPRSRQQKYRITAAGKARLAAKSKEAR